PFLVRREGDRRVPIVTELLVVIRTRFDVTRFVRIAIHAPDLAALILRVNVTGVGWIGEHPEAVTVVHIFPAMVRDPAGILRITDPRTVVLEPAVNSIRVFIIQTHMVKLRDLQVFAFPPFAPAVVGMPSARSVYGNASLRLY